MGFYNSKQVKELLNISSDTTLIKYETEGIVKIWMRLGNRKRYRMCDIDKLLGN